MLHLHGDTHIYETILGLKFRISPEAFFQVNSAATEILYSSALELAKPIDNSTVLDICCGTGTIGLCFAKVIYLSNMQRPDLICLKCIFLGMQTSIGIRISAGSDRRCK